VCNIATDLCCCVSDVSSSAELQSGTAAAVQKPHFVSKKRPPPNDYELYQRKIKRIRERLQLGSPVESNAVMALHEYDKDLKYELVEQTGPVHNPSFTIQLVVNGQVVEVFFITTSALVLGSVHLLSLLFCIFNWFHW